MIPKEIQDHFKAVFEYLQKKPTVDSRDLEFLEAFGRELQLSVERIRARGPKQASEEG